MLSDNVAAKLRARITKGECAPKFQLYLAHVQPIMWPVCGQDLFHREIIGLVKICAHVQRAFPSSQRFCLGYSFSFIPSG